MRTIIRVLLAALACPVVPATADSTLVYESDAGEFRLHLREDALRVDDPGTTWQLYRRDEAAIYTVDPVARRYRRLDAATARALRARLEDLREELRQRLAGLPPARRAAAHAALAERIPGLAPDAAQPTVEPTGEHATVAGHRCARLRVVRAGEPRETLCVAPSETLGIPGAEAATLREMAELMRRLFAGTGFEGIGLPLHRIQGIPLRYRDLATERERRLRQVHREPLDPGLFELPADYRRADGLD